MARFFHLLYNQFAWGYDLFATSVSMGMWKSWVLSIVADIIASPVLEIGFGPGHLYRALQDKGLECYGVDASFRMGRLCLLREGNQRNNGVINGYAQFLPFADQRFQTVVATFPANYILEPDTWLEIKRVLEPGGVIYWLPAAWITGTGSHHRIAAWLFRTTHQVPEDAPGTNDQRFEMIENLGFNVSQEYRPLQDSVVWIVKATPSPANSCN